VKQISEIITSYVLSDFYTVRSFACISQTTTRPGPFLSDRSAASSLPRTDGFKFRGGGKFTQEERRKVTSAATAAEQFVKQLAPSFAFSSTALTVKKGSETRSQQLHWRSCQNKNNTFCDFYFPNPTELEPLGWRVGFDVN
jgi:hypothetical protein